VCDTKQNPGLIVQGERSRPVPPGQEKNLEGRPEAFREVRETQKIRIALSSGEKTEFGKRVAPSPAKTGKNGEATQSTAEAIIRGGVLRSREETAILTSTGPPR